MKRDVQHIVGDLKLLQQASSARPCCCAPVHDNHRNAHGRHSAVSQIEKMKYVCNVSVDNGQSGGGLACRGKRRASSKAMQPPEEDPNA